MIVRRAFILSLVAMSLMAGPAMAQQMDFPAYSFSAHPSQDGRCRGDNGRGDTDRSEPACLAQLTGIAMRQDEKLSLALQNGSSRVYVDRSDGCEGESGECTHYKLTGYFPKHGLLLIEKSYYEGADWMLVRLDSGKETNILVPPHYSPRKNWLASACWSEGPAGCGNGIDIVPTVANQTDRDWHYRLPNNEYALYEFVGWDGEDRVKLTMTFRDGAGNFKTLPASVDRIAGRWQLTLPKEYRTAKRR